MSPSIWTLRSPSIGVNLKANYHKMARINTNISLPNSKNKYREWSWQKPTTQTSKTLKLES